MVLKNQYYKIADNPNLDKTEFLREIYNMVLMPGYEEGYRIKELLGSGLEFILNKDEENQYKNSLIRDACSKLRELV